MKSGTQLRLDKTGKGILTVLRHLNRCQEVRGRLGSMLHRNAGGKVAFATL